MNHCMAKGVWSNFNMGEDYFGREDTPSQATKSPFGRQDQFSAEIAIGECNL